MTDTLPNKLPAGVEQLPRYSYKFPYYCRYNPGATEIGKAIIQYDADTKKYELVDAYACNAGQVLPWGSHKFIQGSNFQIITADTLEEMVEAINDRVGEMDMETLKHINQSEIRRGKIAAYGADYAAWTQENLLNAELVPIEEIDQVEAVVAKDRIYSVSSPEVYIDRYNRTFNKKTSNYEDATLIEIHRSWHQDYARRNVCPGSKTRAIRKLTRPEPKRP